MHRFHVSSTNPDHGEVFLSGEDARHAVTVLRLKPGDRIEVIEGGCLWRSEIVSTDSGSVCVRKTELLPSTEPSVRVTLFQGLPKSDKMDWIVQKATEIGVSEIFPVEMSRSVAKTAGRDPDKKAERWQRITREASKQAGRCIVPEVHRPVTLTDLLQTASLPEVCIVPWEEADSFGPLAFRNAYPSLSSLGILIGPEGGISSEEIRLLEKAGFVPVTLGKRILRTETAGLVAVSAIFSLYGEMEHK